MKIFSASVGIDAARVPDELLLKLLDLQADVELISVFKSNQLLEFWTRIPEGKYPNLIANAHLQASAFGSTYAYEALFSKLVCIKTKYRNHLMGDHINQFLRIASSTTNPCFDKIVESQKQNQVSH